MVNHFFNQQLRKIGISTNITLSACTASLIMKLQNIFHELLLILLFLSGNSCGDEGAAKIFQLKPPRRTSHDNKTPTVVESSAWRYGQHYISWYSTNCELYDPYYNDT